MSYNISSDKFTHPLLKPILLELTEYFKDSGISFFVIGATARDIIMELHDEQSGRLTYDLDIAITINDWSQWHTVETETVSLPNFKKDSTQQQRFLYKDTFALDIVPFGEIMKQGNKIFWPPDESFAMSVLGFDAVEDASLKINVDEEIEINIASLCGIFILKVFAWKDRHQKDNKDADDIGFILANYLEIHREASLEYYDIVYPENHTVLTGGGSMLGIHTSEILNDYPDVKIAVIDILQSELDKNEESLLINQILETNRMMNFDEVYTTLKNVISNFII
jgi:predicted nucleotidyltransferase